LELQDAKTPKEKKCPFVPNKENEGSVLDFQHHALAKIRDIEDLGVLGKKLGVCPYYATRPAAKPSEVSTILDSFFSTSSSREYKYANGFRSRSLHYHIHSSFKRVLGKPWAFRSRTTSLSSTKLTTSWTQSQAYTP
jgi:hypothetical protein